ncbi:conserved hypothetical protein [Alteracholeplasma palmae J233]|uniref:Bacteriophage abortive infection AbiH n=1 Tax=Alteracholeplasma palmae (strain ATCC 49389 / J233) TaxID=1318466 RepID=U4KLC1_ALTPJ|nr:AbiH family protein [Alteracholeplasma palmae]CCV64714.1 conserved hypothetical protein [Alteracholeplasma palmae J233]
MKKINNYSRLIIIGNGFDLMHKLPTSFTEDFKCIAKRHENSSDFWDYYGHGENLWSNFEISLGNPDFNELFTVFDGYDPDYSSDHESDRDSIITQVDLVGHLMESLDEFALNAQAALTSTAEKNSIREFLTQNDYYISFNYTSTLETLYGINHNRIFYPHGQVGHTEIIMGYENGNFDPQPMYEVVDDNMPPREYKNVMDYINNIEDYYIQTAYEQLYDKVYNFSKTPRIQDLHMFIKNLNLNEVVIIGHSCKIDFEYFETINRYFNGIKWTFFYYTSEDFENITKLCNNLGLDETNVSLIKSDF